MGLKKFTKPKFVEQIGRTGLARLGEEYRADFGQHNLALPDVNLEDREYYAAWVHLAVAQRGLPDNFAEALYGIETMATPEGKARLMRAMQHSEARLERVQEATCADFAVQVFLADPELFRRKHDEARMSALSTFDYYGPQNPVDRRGAFQRPDEAMVARIKEEIDTWLGEECEGEERVTEVEVYEVDGEFWFLIRRGDTFARLAVVEPGGFRVKRLRPARDLVVVYSPERDELRVHGRTAGEKSMCRDVFGRRLMGERDYFRVKKTFTLKPLRDEGVDALTVVPEGGIDKIVLTELEARTDDAYDGVFVWKATDLFAFAATWQDSGMLARHRMVRAGFEVHFTGCAKPRMVYLTAGHRLRVTRHCDAAAVHRWLTVRGFRSGEEEMVNRVAA